VLSGLAGALERYFYGDPCPRRAVRQLRGEEVPVGLSEDISVVSIFKRESSVFITRWSRPERGWLHFEVGAGGSSEFRGPLKHTSFFPWVHPSVWVTAVFLRKTNDGIACGLYHKEKCIFFLYLFLFNCRTFWHKSYRFY